MTHQFALGDEVELHFSDGNVSQGRVTDHDLCRGVVPQDWLSVEALLETDIGPATYRLERGRKGRTGLWLVAGTPDWVTVVHTEEDGLEEDDLEFEDGDDFDLSHYDGSAG